MVQTAEQKLRLRYKKDLESGAEPVARTSANMAILEQVRVEIQQEVAAGKKRLRDTTDKGVKRIKTASRDGLQEISDALQQGLLQISTASSSGIERAPVEQGAVVAPEEEEEEEEAENDDDRDREEDALALQHMETRTLEQARRAAGRMALLHNLPMPSAEMPSWFAKNVETYYRTNPAFKRELRERREDARKVVDAHLKPVRDGCLECRGERRACQIAYGKRVYLPPWLSCADHQSILDNDTEAQLDAELRDEFGGEAAQAAMLRRKVDEASHCRRLEAFAAEDRAIKHKEEMLVWETARREEVMAAVRLEFRPECSVCRGCIDADFVIGGLCSRHEDQIEMIVKDRCASRPVE